MPSHQDRIAVVTGAARGIGRSISRMLAQRGATIVAVDLDEPSETIGMLEKAGHQATGIRADVSDPDQTRILGEEVRRRHGRCDILVNKIFVIG
jgi:NAD(P)-dependent dehydrogenase (short-subunit alcohol dehydrogenase family)